MISLVKQTFDRSGFPTGFSSPRQPCISIKSEFITAMRDGRVKINRKMTKIFILNVSIHSSPAAAYMSSVVALYLSIFLYLLPIRQSSVFPELNFIKNCFRSFSCLSFSRRPPSGRLFEQGEMKNRAWIPQQHNTILLSSIVFGKQQFFLTWNKKRKEINQLARSSRLVGEYLWYLLCAKAVLAVFAKWSCALSSADSSLPFCAKKRHSSAPRS